jgi:alpha-N-arabinofuranosidase
MLGVRPIEGYNMFGRETFLTSVSFQGEQPIFIQGLVECLMEDKFLIARVSGRLLPIRDVFDFGFIKILMELSTTPFEKMYELKNSNLFLI